MTWSGVGGPAPSEDEDVNTKVSANVGNNAMNNCSVMILPGTKRLLQTHFILLTEVLVRYHW